MNCVEEFIKRRFPTDCNWTTGNCYYFAIILKERFNGTVYYDPIEGHFLCEINSNFYDYTGKVDLDPTTLYNWNCYKEQDELNYQHIVRDCCM